VGGMGEGVLALEAGPAGGRRRACIPVIVVSVRARAPAPAKRRGAHAAGGSVSRAPPPRCRARTPARGVANTSLDASPVAPRPRHRRRALRTIARPMHRIIYGIAGEYDYDTRRPLRRASRDAPAGARAGPGTRGGSAHARASCDRDLHLVMKNCERILRAGLEPYGPARVHEPRTAPVVRRPSASARPRVGPAGRRSGTGDKNRKPRFIA